jgi:glutamate/aspartate transport system substrate-binding protein
MKLPIKACLTAVATTALLSLPVQAQTAAGTLAKIKETGEIRLGHRDVSIPFSYLDDQQKPVGYAMDLCAKIVDAVKAELKTPTLAVKMQPIQLSNQIPLIQNGTIDIVCGPSTNTLERQKVVAFSNTIFVSSIRAVVRKDSPVKSFEDMNGKPVSMTAASTSIGLLTTREQEKKFQTNKVLSPDHGAAFLALTTGRTEAFVMDDILLAGLVANNSNPGNWRMIDDALRVEPYGLIVRKDDPAFKALVDKTLGALIKNGDFQNLYNKWFMSPIPPKNVNLNFPMPAPLKDAMANPNDRGV